MTRVCSWDVAPSPGPFVISPDHFLSAPSRAGVCDDISTAVEREETTTD
jgi:hypothetical protein